MIVRRSMFVLAAASLVIAGCGGGGSADVSASQRVERCLEKQPEATKSDCEQWEDDGQLGDDGVHEGHKG